MDHGSRIIFRRAFGAIGRSERIRTSGPCVPNTVLYQAELHSEADHDVCAAIAGGGEGRKRVGAPWRGDHRAPCFALQ